MKRFLVIQALVLAAFPAAASAEEIKLPGHRAVYELSLGKSDGNATVVGAEGRYVFDLEDVCSGYTLNERLVVRLAREGDTVLTDYRLSAYEAADGELYRFSTETEFNGLTGQSAEGNLSVDNGTAELDYKTADDVTFDEEVLAPLAHIRAILEAAAAGEERHAATVFDGDVDKPTFFAVTRIAKNDAVAEGTGKDVIDMLDGIESWRIDSVYFPPSGDTADTAVPEFRFTGTLYANGVVNDLMLDYGDFALNAALQELEVYEGGC